MRNYRFPSGNETFEIRVENGKGRKGKLINNTVLVNFTRPLTFNDRSLVKNQEVKVVPKEFPLLPTSCIRVDKHLLTLGKGETLRRRELRKTSLKNLTAFLPVKLIISTSRREMGSSGITRILLGS